MGVHFPFVDLGASICANGELHALVSLISSYPVSPSIRRDKGEVVSSCS